MGTGLARVTINAPQRRVDVALPEQVPLVDLLPEVLRHAGEGLADQGEQHGGWVLRRGDGTALTTGQALLAQGVRDGELLHLVPAHTDWAELEYDDVVEAIAEGVRRGSTAWSGSATRTAALVGAGVLLAIGLLVVLAAGPGWLPGAPLALGAALVLVLSGAVASRAYADRSAGTTLGGWALPYAFLGGALLVATGDRVGILAPIDWIGAPEALAGAAAVLVAAVLGVAGVATGLRVFAAGVILGLLGALTALAGFVLNGAAAAAVLLCVQMCGVGVLPLLAIRFGKLPLPPITVPAAGGGVSGNGSASGDGRTQPARWPSSRVFTAVTRTDELLTGMLAGYALLALVAIVLLVSIGGPAGRVLAALACVALLLRARAFVALRHRALLVGAGLVGLVPLGLTLAGDVGGGGRLVFVAGALPLALLVVVAGAVFSRRPPSPYLGRAADIADTVAMVSAVPVACAVLGLYGRVRGLLP